MLEENLIGNTFLGNYMDFIIGFINIIQTKILFLCQNLSIIFYTVKNT